jgi:hypothetical protein
MMVTPNMLGFRGPAGYSLPSSYPPAGFTPDATTAVTTPGVYYRPYNFPDGTPAPLYKTGPRNDGFITGNGQQFFDGNLLWNRRVGNEDVTAAINNLDYLFLQGDQWTKWQQGLTPMPPNYNFPSNYPPLPGTPPNPFGGLPPYTSMPMGAPNMPMGAPNMPMGAPNMPMGAPNMGIPQYGSPQRQQQQYPQQGVPRR